MDDRGSSGAIFPFLKNKYGPEWRSGFPPFTWSQTEDFWGLWESDREGVFGSTLESLKMWLSQGTPGELRQRLGETSIESATEGCSPHPPAGTDPAMLELEGHNLLPP